MFGALDVPLPELDSITEEKDEVAPAKDEWAVVLGGASNVGKFAVQVRLSRRIDFVQELTKVHS